MSMLTLVMELNAGRLVLAALPDHTKAEMWSPNWFRDLADGKKREVKELVSTVSPNMHPDQVSSPLSCTFATPYILSI